MTTNEPPLSVPGSTRHWNSMATLPHEQCVPFSKGHIAHYRNIFGKGPHCCVLTLADLHKPTKAPTAHHSNGS